MRLQTSKCLLLGFVLIFSSFSWAEADKHALWTIDDLLLDDSRPYAIGHRGYGENLGENPDKPIENTIESVRRAFEEGISIVEVDVSVTADGKAVAIHDDFLSDFTCINTLTYDELKERLHYVPTLAGILRTAKKFARKNSHLSGLVDIEVKTPAPLCDINDTTESKLVAAVIDAVEKTKMDEQVIIEGFSPSLIAMFSTEASHLRRNLSVNVLQLLSPTEIEAITGLPVKLIDKQVGFGLQWAEIGGFFRLPGYQSLEEYVNVAYSIGAQFVTLDKLILIQLELLQPGSGALFIQQLHQMEFTVTSYTVDTESEWELLSAMGVDGLFTNDIPMGVSFEVNQKIIKRNREDRNYFFEKRDGRIMF